MKKHLISITKRQDSTLKPLSEELGISFSELVRKALDGYIEKMVVEGKLIRHTFVASTKEAVIDTPAKMFNKMYEYALANPDGAIKLVEG